MKEFPLISIITVVYNSELYIEKTILSVLNQSYSNIQYIIIDGGSTDGTAEMIKKYESRISYWVSEPDKGIYDAMNKGLAQVAGDYIWFINSGDQIKANTTLFEIVKGIQESNADIVYGDTEIIDIAGEVLGARRLSPPKNLTWKSFRRGMLVCHQAMIVRQNIVNSFDLRYNYSADFDWAICCMKNASIYHNSHQVLVQFLAGGQTSKTILPGLFERFRIMRHHYGFLSTILAHCFILIRFPFSYMKK